MTNLNTPMQIGKLQLKNRLVMPPMATGKSTDEDTVSEAICAYYDEKSRGGYIGLIIAEHSYVSAEGKASRNQASISRDSDVEGLKKMVEVIHRNGSPVFAQINHAGSAADRAVTGCAQYSASALYHPRKKEPTELPCAMTQEDINKVVADFAAAAGRAKAAGFDGVEIHSAHSYLLNQFYSPLTNKRTDAYGGTLSGRIRLHLEIIRAVRETVGADYPIALRLGACDYMEGGSTIEDGVQACAAFEQAGVDLLDISGGFCSYMRPGVTEPGYFSDATEAIKKQVSVPVILTGGIVDAEAAERLLQEGKADLIGVGRAILKDSEWAKNAMTAIENK